MGIVFWMTLATDTLVGGRAGGAASCFAQPEAIAAKATKRIEARTKRAEHQCALKFPGDRVMI
jgi:hypothetical protein